MNKAMNFRLLWVSTTNLAALVALLAWVRQEHGLRTLLAEPGRSTSILQTLVWDPWNLITIAVLLAGILFESLKIRLGWLPNVGFYLCSFVVGRGELRWLAMIFRGSTSKLQSFSTCSRWESFSS